MMTPHDGQPTFAAGWYADVNVPGTERWYDGIAWTEHVRAVEMQVAPATVAAATTGYAAPVTEAAAYAAPVTEVGAYAAPASGLATSAVKPPWYKRKGIVIPVAIVVGLVVVGGGAAALSGGESGNTVADKPAASQAPKAENAPVEEIVLVMVDVPDVVGMTGSDAQAALSALGFKVDAGGGDLAMPVTAQDITAGAQAEEGATVRLTLQEKPKLTLSQNNALRSATQYLDFMHFSRTGLIEQLTSEYGEGYPMEDAEFAVATLEQTGKVDWNAEAAEAAQSYLDLMSFSRDGLYDQLTSSYGEGFTPEQANAGLAAVGY